MNKLDTSLLGGFPFDLNDLEWQFDAYERAFADVVRGFGSSFIIHGCVPTTVALNTYDISAGAVVMDGELYPFAGVAGLVIADPAEAWYVVSATLDPSGAEAFEDLVTRNAYQKRIATIVQTASPASPNAAVFGQRLEDVILAKVGTVAQPWAAPTLGNSWVAQGIPYNPLTGYRKELGLLVRLRGTVNGSSASANGLFTLPVGFRPGFTLRSQIGSIINPAIQRIVEVNGAGVVSILLGGAPTSDDVFDLASVPAFEGA
jgi:hypothetical protein